MLKFGAASTPLEASLGALPHHKELATTEVMTDDQVKVDPVFYSFQVIKCFLDTIGSLVEQMHLRWVEGNNSCETYPGIKGDARQPSSDEHFPTCLTMKTDYDRASCKGPSQVLVKIKAISFETVNSCLLVFVSYYYATF